MKQIVKVLLLLCLASGLAQAQQLPMQFFRPATQNGINVFETNKTDTTKFTGVHVNVGGAFAQHYQSLSTSNYVTNSDGSILMPVGQSKLTKTDSNNILSKLTGGFNLAMANLYLDAQLADGIRVNVTAYLSTRHHEDTWVKNGYLQMDAAKFLNSDFVNDVFKYITVKVGDLEVDYGDAHFRRADGGNEMYDAFIDNNIMDEFATEIGAEIYFHDPSGFLAMVGATDGMLNPTVRAALAIDSSTGALNSYEPAYHLKLGYDKQINSDLRVRLTGSFYTASSTASSTLFGGDRAGSNYVTDIVTASTLAAASSGDENLVFTDGRYNPSFSEAISTFMINPFVKFGGLELFGTYESAKGRKIIEKDTRSATQLAGDLLYRFGSHENFWVGVRYNQLKAQPAPGTAAALATATANGATIPDITISRICASAGWFLTESVMMKLEYVTQKYDGFDDPIITKMLGGAQVLSGAKFSGVMVEAAIGF